MLNDRLTQVEKSLARLREQLAGKEDALTTIAPEERVRIKQQINDLKGEIKPFEEEYWKILTKKAASSEIVDSEAEIIVAEIVEQVEPLQQGSKYPPEVLDLLHKIYIEVSKPENSAAAKLKGALSLLPPFVSLSYEAEIDTESFLQTNFPTFKKWISSLAKKKIVSPNQLDISEFRERSYNNFSRPEGIKVENYFDVFRSYNLEALSEGLLDASEEGKVVFFKDYFDEEKFLKNITPVFADTDCLAHNTGVINCIAFSNDKNEPWGGSISEKSNRNRSHAKKNPKTLLLFKSKNAQPSFEELELSLEWLGFTHIIPVSLEIWNRYLNGEIKDNSFSSDYICSQEDKVYGLIVFSLALYRNHFSQCTLSFSKSLIDIQNLIKVLIYHLNSLINIHFSTKQQIPILTQTDSRYFSNFLEKNNFIKHSVRSADNCLIYSSCIYIHPN